MPAPRPHRPLWQRLVLVLNCLLVVGFLGAAGGLAYAYGKYGQIPRVEIGQVLTAGDDGVDDDPTGAQNFLVVGVDSAAGLDPDDPLVRSRTQIGGLRSDTMMVLRVDPASTRAALLSLPRDLYVPIPGGGNGRINEAVQIGGPELLVETIQDFFGIPINHYVQIDFYGFGRIVEAIDGVPLAFANPVRDQRSGLSVPEPGCVTLDPANALGFVRSRAYQEFVGGRWRTDGTGDLGRIQRQQQFVIAALQRAFDRGLRNPVTLDAVIDSTLDAVTVDDTLDGDDIIDLASQFRSFDPSSLDLYELPVGSTSVGGASLLRLQAAQAEPVLSVFRGIVDGDPTPSSVRVRVLNGTGTPGEAADAATALRDAEFAIAGTGDAPRLGVARTEVRHPASATAAAQLLARWLVADARVVVADDVDVVTLVTGADWAGLLASPRPAPEAAPTTLPTTTTTATDRGSRGSTSTTAPIGSVDAGALGASGCG